MRSSIFVACCLALVACDSNVSHQKNDGAINDAIIQHYHRTHTSSAFGTFFKYAESCWITADHVVEEMPGLDIFHELPRQRRHNGLDIALFGDCDSVTSAPSPERAANLRLEGYPAGSETISRRHGQVLFQREPGVWILVLAEGQHPAVVGMSGAPVYNDENNIVGVLITRNSPYDHDANPNTKDRESVDFAQLKTKTTYDSVLLNYGATEHFSTSLIPAGDTGLRVPSVPQRLKFYVDP